MPASNRVETEDAVFHRRGTVRKVMAALPEHSFSTNWELHGWFMYDFANGAFFYGASPYFASLVPAQALEVAKEHFCGACLENEWAEDFENKGVCSNDSFDTYMSCEGNGDEWTAKIGKEASYVPFFGVEVGYASVFFICTVISVVLQLTAFLTMGSFADYGPNRKKMFFFFNKLGVLALLVVIFFKNDSHYLVNASMYIISTVCFSFCVVFYNAYMPLLVKALPEMKAVVDKEKNNPDKGEANVRIKEAEDEHMGKLSIKGIACGFIGVIIFLCGAFVMTWFSPPTNKWSTRLAIFTAGIWVLVFSTFTFVVLKERPGPPLPEGETYFEHSSKQAYGTLKNFKHLPELGKFMFSYFIFSDGTSTLAGAAIAFAQVELNFTFVQIGITLLLVTITGAAGCLIWWKIQTTFKISQKHVLMANLSLMGIIPLWGFIGMKTGSKTADIECYLAVILFGLNTGSQQAYTRTIYATLLPYGREAEYFSFYEVSDKGTAWLGPLVLWIVFDATGSFRKAFVFLEFFFVFGIFLIWLFDENKALKEKHEFDIEHNTYFVKNADQSFVRFSSAKGDDDVENTP